MDQRQCILPQGLIDVGVRFRIESTDDPTKPNTTFVDYLHKTGEVVVRGIGDNRSWWIDPRNIFSTLEVEALRAAVTAFVGCPMYVHPATDLPAKVEGLKRELEDARRHAAQTHEALEAIGVRMTELEGVRDAVGKLNDAIGSIKGAPITVDKLNTIHEAWTLTRDRWLAHCGNDSKRAAAKAKR